MKAHATPLVSLSAAQAGGHAAVIAHRATCSVLIALFVLLSATAAAQGRQALAQGSQATVHAVWFSGGKGKAARGGTSKVQIRVQPNDRALPSVGVLEQYPGATGNKWQTSAWLAAFNASEALGRSLTAHEFTVKAYGNIDGPSAGMLLTGTMMALMSRAPLLPNTTMTGTVNPDGSAGPVGGIVQKLEGAARSGIKRFGYPYGNRFTEDRRTGRTLDLHAVGRRLGIEVVAITNLHEAYRFLTGRTLLRPLPAAGRHMRIEGPLRGKLTSALKRWKQRYNAEAGQLKAKRAKLSASVLTEIDPLWNQAQLSGAAAARFEKQGKLAAAYDAYASGAQVLKVAAELVTFVPAMQQKKDKTLIKHVERMAKAGSKLKKLGRTMDIQGLYLSISDRVSGAAAMQPYVGASAFRMLGKNTLAAAKKLLANPKASAKKRQAARLALARCVAYFTRMGELMEVARDDLSFRAPSQPKRSLVASSRSEATLGAAYASAARAAMRHFDSIFIDPQVAKHGVARPLVRELFTNRDPMYAVGWHAANIAANVTGTGGAMALLKLAASSYAYTGAAHLMDRYYVLRYQPLANGQMQVRNHTVLAAQLTEARARAMEAAGAARTSLGFVPGAAQLAYNIAHARESGSDSDKVEALRQYRLCTFWARTALGIKS